MSVSSRIDSVDTGNSASHRIARESVYVFLLGLLLFTLGLWQQPFIDFESRFALFAQEMWRHGLTLFPTTYGEPYPDYPVTGTVLIWLSSLPFGGVTKFSAILPTALAAAFSMALLYRLLADFSKRWALLALSLQAMTMTFLAEARSISLDQMLASVTLLGFYVAYREQDAQRNIYGWLALIFLAGFALRGPLGVVIPAGVICGYYAVLRDWRKVLLGGLLATVILLVAWGALLALAAKLYGESFAWDIARMQVFGRLEAREAGQPLYYFLSSFGNYALAYPLALIVMAALVPKIFANDRSSATQKLLLGCIVWVAIVLVGLSIPHVKKARYLLPIVPALAILAAYPWLDTTSRALRYVKSSCNKLFLVLPLLLAIVVAVIRHRSRHHHADIQLAWTTLYFVLALAQIVAIYVYRRWQSERDVAIAIIAALAVWMVNLFGVEPALRQLHDTSRFVAQVEAIRANKAAPLVLFGMTRDGEAIKYAVNVPYDFSPTIALDAAQLAQQPRPSYVMVRDRNLEAISQLVSKDEAVLTGSFDGHPFSLFYLP
ncbi:MAG TPA: glycosyltransferase family 39 protein [Spongiibacteraceae bacterium]|nr:glycosyltransferase family 39 protein [Spongiibacteraceae bacterium]